MSGRVHTTCDVFSSACLWGAPSIRSPVRFELKQRLATGSRRKRLSARRWRAYRNAALSIAWALGRLAAALGLLGSGFPAFLSRPRRGVLRGRGEGLGLLERDDGAPFRGMDSAQRAQLAFLRFAQRRLVRPPLARVPAPSEKRQHGKRNRDERDHVPSYHDVPTM